MIQMGHLDDIYGEGISVDYIFFNSIVTAHLPIYIFVGIVMLK